jgi:hypothetical protein
LEAIWVEWVEEFITTSSATGCDTFEYKNVDSRCSPDFLHK